MEDDINEPWHACRDGWCAGVDHVSTSLINQNVRSVYADIHPSLTVGFVLAGSMAYHCAMVDDGGTVMDAEGGCERRCTCGDPGCSWCVYRPHQVADFVSALLDAHSCEGGWCGGSNSEYNEVVILKADWEAALPASIIAVFCVNDDDGECLDARDVHARFLAAYGLSAANVLLLRYQHEAGFAALS